MPVKTIHVPTMGDSITEGTIVDIPVAPGDYVNEDDVVLVLETDKVSVDVRASEGGRVMEILGEVDDVVEVGSALYRLDTDAVAPAAVSDAPKTASSKVDNAEEETPSIVAATPAASNIAPPAAAPKKATIAPPPPTTVPAMDFITTSLGNRPERRSKMSRMR
jgi:2-oxoglutarate dehydrogenase E2 component (dihydrolipoamide succinyltransferase)